MKVPWLYFLREFEMRVGFLLGIPRKNCLNHLQVILGHFFLLLVGKSCKWVQF